jgi:hypothetical protein
MLRTLLLLSMTLCAAPARAEAVSPLAVDATCPPPTRWERECLAIADDSLAARCELCTLRLRAGYLEADAATLTTQRDGLYSQTEDLARRLAAAVRERDAEHDAALQRARWSLLLGAGGAGGIAAGIALAVHGDGTAGAIAGGLGLVALAAGVATTW